MLKKICLVVVYILICSTYALHFHDSAKVTTTLSFNFGWQKNKYLQDLSFYQLIAITMLRIIKIFDRFLSSSGFRVYIVAKVVGLRGCLSKNRPLNFP